METSNDLHTFKELNQFLIIESSPNKRFFKTNHVLEKLNDKILFLALDSESGKETTWHSILSGSFDTTEQNLEILKSCRAIHPNIMEVFETWKNSEKELVVVSEFINCSLKGFAQNSKERPRKNVVKNWAKGILTALDYFHSKNFNKVLIDPNYENVFINTSNGQVKVLEPKFYFLSGKSSETGPDYLENSMKKDVSSLGSFITSLLSASSSSDWKNSPKNQEKNPEDSDLKTFIFNCIHNRAEKSPISRLLNSTFITDPGFQEPSPNPQKNLKNPYKKLKDLSIDHLSKRNLLVKLLTKNSIKEKTNLEYKINIQKNIPEKIAEDILHLSHIHPAEVFNILNRLDESIKYPSKAPEQKTPYFKPNPDNIIKFSLKLKIEDLEKAQFLKVEVSYYPEKDSPESLARKILQDFDLDLESYSQVLSIINGKLKDFSFSNDCYFQQIDNYSLKRANSKPHDTTSESLNIGRWSLDSLSEPLSEIDIE